MRRAAAVGESANRITLLRDATRRRRRGGDPRNLPGEPEPALRHGADRRHVLCRQHRRPGVVRLYAGGDAPDRAGAQAGDVQTGAGHWTRSLLPNADGTKIYIGVGSQTNIADDGMDVEEGRAAIHEYDVATGACRIFASGLRNAVGMAWEPVTGALWTVVNERDGLGDETPPDYLTSVRGGRVLRLAVLLLGQDGRRPGEAGRGDGGQGTDAGLRPRRAYRLARFMLAAGGDAAGVRRRHGDRPARVVEPQQAQRLQAGVSFRSRTAVPAGRRGISCPVSWHRTRKCRTAGRSA